MCSNSSDNCILCSEETYIPLKEKYTDFVKRTKEIKGKGLMNIYLYNPYKNKSSLWETRIGVMRKNNRDGSGASKNFASNTNLNNLNNLRRKSSSIIKPEYFNKNNKLVKQNTILENSNFILEQSMDLLSSPQKVDSMTVKSKTINEKTSANMSNLTSLKHENSGKLTETNIYYQNSCYFFRFNNEEIEAEFLKYLESKFYKYFKKSHITNLVFLISMTIGVYNFLEPITSEYSTGSLLNLIKVLIYIIYFSIITIINTIQKKEDLFKGLILGIYLAITILIQIQMAFLLDFFLINLTLEQNFTILACSFNGILNFRNNFINFIVYIVIFVINMSINNTNIRLIKYNTFSCVICISIYTFQLIREYVSSLEYTNEKQLGEEVKKIEDLLFNLMPPHVVQNLKEDLPVVDVLNDNNVTFLFADICGFTDYSATVEPQVVVNLIKSLFEQFDVACKQSNVYKVHTIGDCYVALGWTGRVPMHERNPLEELKNVIKLSKKMATIIESEREKIKFEALNMRIGIHTVKYLFI